MLPANRGIFLVLTNPNGFQKDLTQEPESYLAGFENIIPGLGNNLLLLVGSPRPTQSKVDQFANRPSCFQMGRLISKPPGSPRPPFAPTNENRSVLLALYTICLGADVFSSSIANIRI